MDEATATEEQLPPPPLKVTVEKILEIESNTPRNNFDMFHTVQQLLAKYPQFAFVRSSIWRDFKKCFNRQESGESFVCHEQLERLLIARNHMKHIVTHVSAKKNKKEIFEAMSHLMGEMYVLGGEPSPKTGRIEILFAGESMRVCFHRWYLH